MSIILKTTEDKKLLVNAFSAATSLKDYVAEHEGEEVSISNFFIFEKGEIELTVVILESGEILGTNSKTINQAVKFLYDMGIDEFPIKANIFLKKSKNNREYLDIEF